MQHIISSLPELFDWACSQAAPHTVGQPPAAAAAAAEDIAGVIWRHAMGQGLKPGDDWGWILDQYDSAAVAKIVAASIENAGNRRGR
jgi:hypothetical protein